MVRDRFEGVAMARLMARLILVIGMAPIIAPSLGSLVLTWSGWRSLFLVLALAAVSLAVLAYVAIEETLPPERRRPAQLRASLAAYAALLRDGRFLALGVIGGAMMSTLFAYVAGASFVLQDGFGVSEQTFGLLFGLNAASFIIGSQVNPVLLRRLSLLTTLTTGILLTVTASAALLLAAITGVGGIVGVVLPMAVMLFAGGLSMPNTPALALANHGTEAGTAAAVLGCLQFGIGGLIAPAVGAFGTTTAVPMGVAMLTMSTLAATLVLTVVRRS
jgi:DHA1 family bicyclomycin/chloramphenicol resistance-like MFS transporter